MQVDTTTFGEKTRISSMVLSFVSMDKVSMIWNKENSPGEVPGRDCECRLKYCPANMLKHNFPGDTYEKGFKIPSQHNISRRSSDVSYFAGSNHIKTRFHRDFHF